MTTDKPFKIREHRMWFVVPVVDDPENQSTINDSLVR